jgi:DNA-binding NarL/FixJ family response regulator
VSLVTRTADAVTAAGHPQRAVSLVRDQLAQLSADAPAHHRARLLMAEASAALLTDLPAGALEATTEALSLVPDDATPLRARLLSVHAHAAADRGRDDEAARHGVAALQLARDLELPSVVSYATTTLASIDQRSGDPAAALDALERIVAEARLTSDTGAEMRGLFLLGGLHHERAEYAEAQESYALAAATAAAAGRPWAPYGIDARVMQGVTAYHRGLWDDTLTIVDHALDTPPPIAEGVLDAVRMLVLVGRGDASALDLFARHRPLWDRDGLLVVLASAAAIDAHGDRGDVSAMLAAHDDAVRTTTRFWHEYYPGRARLSALVLGQLAQAATTAPASERAELAARLPDLTDAVEGVWQRVEKRSRPFGPEGMAWLARARAEAMRLRWLTDVDSPDEETLVGAWREAVEGFTVMGNPFELARSQARLAAVLRAVGEPQETRDLLQQARQSAARLGAEPLQAELRRVAPHARDRAAAGPTRTDLTAREVEILTLVAEGRSNGEIARQLFISAKTVSVHVSNILAKLGAAGRTEAAAIARRGGLLGEDLS